VLNDRLANDVRQNGTHSSGTNDDRVLRALVRNEYYHVLCSMFYIANVLLLQLSQLTKIVSTAWLGP